MSGRVALPFCSAAVVVLVMVASMPCAAFPPYRSTDADTAAPWTLEARLGLLRFKSERGAEAYSSPLLRLNLGLPAPVELISEFEYSADEGRTADAAAGLKWVPIRRAVSIGVETLALLPVSGVNDGAGVESQLLATLRHEHLLLHVNAGGSYDSRPRPAESGWRTSILAEFPYGRLRPGIELFAKRTEDEPAQVQAGPGLIVDLHLFDVRVAVHGGLTDAADDLTVNLWLATKFSVR